MKPILKLVHTDLIQSGSHQLDEKSKKIKTLISIIDRLGLIEPIAVKKTSNGYSIVLGESRFLAAKLAGLSTVPVMEIMDDEHKLHGKGKQSSLTDLQLYIKKKLQLLM